MTQQLVSKKELRSVFGVPYSFADVAARVVVESVRVRDGNTPSETTVRISPSLGGQRGVPCDKITNKLGQSIRPLGQRRRTPEAV